MHYISVTLHTLFSDASMDSQVPDCINSFRNKFELITYTLHQLYYLCHSHVLGMVQQDYIFGFRGE